MRPLLSYQILTYICAHVLAFLHLEPTLLADKAHSVML